MAELLVRHKPSSASALRRELALDLDLCGVSQDVVEDATLVLSELLGNAIRHGGCANPDEVDVAWHVRPHDVVVSVEDPSDALPVARNAAPDAPGGRGLAIVSSLAADWGVERTTRGKRVWARIALS